MAILLLLLLFQIKHCYADFVIQTYEQTIRKGIYRDVCGISHSMDHIYTSIIALLLFSIYIPLSPIAIIAVSFIEGIVHYHIDWIKVRFGTKDQSLPSFWANFGYDQLAHQVTYLVMVAYLLV